MLRLNDDVAMWGASLELFCKVANEVRDRSLFTPAAAGYLVNAVTSHFRNEAIDEILSVDRRPIR